MNVYRDANGVWVGTQALAGNKDVIDLPTTSKSEMLEWLNANVPPTNTSSPVVVAPSPDMALGKCPKCRLTPAGAEKLAKGIAVDAIAKRIETAPQWEANRLIESAIWRLTELKNATTS